MARNRKKKNKENKEPAKTGCHKGDMIRDLSTSKRPLSINACSVSPAWPHPLLLSIALLGFFLPLVSVFGDAELS